MADGNFTPQARTPWGGQRIAELKGIAARSIGESWEVSVEPDFPSRVESGTPLKTLIASNPAEWLGAHEAHGGLGLLVKLLDAKENLSVQIHPADDFSGLQEGESGKPEAWYVVAADEGAAIYLGLQEGVGISEMSHAISTNAEVSKLLNRIPCKPGDYFVIPPKTPHAVGAGLTLVEPQQVLPRTRGLTYRYWDWNRRYDKNGQRDPNGLPRELHVDVALEVTDWNAPRGDALVEVLRRHTPQIDPAAPVEQEDLSSPLSPLMTTRLSGTGRISLDPGRFRALCVLGGQVQFETFDLTVGPGRSAVIPAIFEGQLCLKNAHALLCALG